jgi:hypothetical protein
MKKAILFTVMVILTSAMALAAVGVKVTYFSPSDAEFKSIYGGGPMFGAEFDFSIMPGLDVWLDGGYFAKTGELTVTKEETKLTLIPIGAGLRYKYPLGMVAPYAAAGARYYIYKESNVIGDVSGGGIGFVGRVGVLVSAVSAVNFDLSVGFSTCTMQPDDFEFNVGGLELSLAITF